MCIQGCTGIVELFAGLFPSQIQKIGRFGNLFAYFVIPPYLCVQFEASKV